jgi:S-adenosylmethionine synthetase
MRPAAIIKRLKLKEPIYSHSASYGHMGRKPEVVELTFQVNGATLTRTVETFTWEKLDYVDAVKEAFGI